jgi:predicted transposase YdaD
VDSRAARSLWHGHGLEVAPAHERMAGPHDRFFRYLFGLPERAEALLRHNLPAAVVAEVDWSTLRLESGTRVQGGRETRQDLLYSARGVQAGESAPRRYFLIEHQSKVERSMALRLHDYVWRLIAEWREQNPASRWIPEVTALVVYAGRSRSWSAPLRLEDHYRLPEQAGSWEQRLRWVVRFGYRVDDLSSQSEQAVRGRAGPPLVALGLLVLRFARSEQLAGRLPEWSELFARVLAEVQGELALFQVVRYLHELGDEQVRRVLRRVIDSVMKPKRAEVLMRSVADVLRAEGRKEGKAQGLAEGEARGLARAVLQLLAARGVRVDPASRRRIQRCRDVARLERWHERAVSATRLSEVLDGPAQ